MEWRENPNTQKGLAERWSMGMGGENSKRIHNAVSCVFLCWKCNRHEKQLLLQIDAHIAVGALQYNEAAVSGLSPLYPWCAKWYQIPAVLSLDGTTTGGHCFNMLHLLPWLCFRTGVLCFPVALSGVNPWLVRQVRTLHSQMTRSTSIWQRQQPLKAEESLLSSKLKNKLQISFQNPCSWHPNLLAIDDYQWSCITFCQGIYRIL